MTRRRTAAAVPTTCAMHRTSSVDQHMPAKPRSFNTTDLAALAGLPLLTGLAWLTSESSWPLVGNTMAPLAAPFSIGAGDLAQCVATLLALREGAVGGARILRGMIAQQVGETITMMACHRHGGW